jgi:Phosphotransferase enzyme family
MSRLADHPAVTAWRELRPERLTPRCIEIVRDSESRAIYRLDGVGCGGSAVIAKRCRLSTASIEHTVYDEILPRLPFTTLRYYGFVREDDGFAWLFLEDVGRVRFSRLVAQQRMLVGRWLALMHTFARSVGASAGLPDRGQRHYLEHLRAARRDIRLNIANPAVAGSDVDLLWSVIALCDDLESHWNELDQCFDGAPATLVHGDFRPKNVHLRTIDSEACVFVLDWETAGWGPPAVDLAPARGPYSAHQVDVATYRSIAHESWAKSDSHTIGRLVAAGTIFRRLAAMAWASSDLTFDDVSLPVSRLRVYRAELLEAVQTAMPGNRLRLTP